VIQKETEGTESRVCCGLGRAPVGGSRVLDRGATGLGHPGWRLARTSPALPLGYDLVPFQGTI